MSPTPPSLHLSAITALCICEKITTFYNMFTSWFQMEKPPSLEGKMVFRF